MRRLPALGVLLLLGLLGSVALADAQGILRTGPKGTTPAGSPTSTAVDANTQAVDVFLRGGGGSGGTSATDNSVFTGGSTAVTPIGALYDTTPPAITDGNVGIPLMDSGRRLFTVFPSAQHIICDSGCGGAASFSDNTAFTFGTTAVNLMGAVVDDTATNLVTENSGGAPRMSPRRLLYTLLRNPGDTANMGDATTPLRVDPTGTTTQPVSGTVTAVQATATNLRIAGGDAAGAPTAGTVLAVQGIASGTAMPVSGTFWQATQPVSGTVTANQGTANATPWNENLAQVSGSAVSTAATGVQKVGVTGNAGAALDAASGAAPPANRVAIGGLGSGATAGLLLSPTYCDSFVNVNVSTATTTLLVTGVSGRHVRLCAISLVTAAANNVALISGTGATCGTGTTGMTGGTTAATGYNFAANGGIAQGSGVGVINQTNATGDSVCVVTSAATQLSGRISYAIY